MKLTLFDFYPELTGLYWHADEAAQVILFGTSDSGKESSLLFSLANELGAAAVRDEIQSRPYDEEVSKELALRGEYPPLMLNAASVMEWALLSPELVQVCEETKFWYQSKRVRRFSDCITDDEKVEFLSRMLNPEVFNLAKQKFMAAGISDHQRQIADKNPKHQFTRQLKAEARTLWAERRQKFKSKGQFSQWFVEYIWKRYPDKLKELRLEIQEHTVAYEWIKGK